LFSGLMTIAAAAGSDESRAATWVRPDSSGSRLDGRKKVAEKPPETPKKAAEMPASGWRPAA